MILITGGTGTLAHALLPLFLAQGEDVTVFSRGEYAQHLLRLRYGETNVRYVIGDVRDQGAVADACQAADTVVHAAALKIIPVAERQPFEVQHTNVIGTHNVVRTALRSPATTRVLTIGSDKSCRASTSYGASKHLAERIVVAAGEEALHRRKVFASVRYGNVLGSRGSVLEVWRRQIAQGLPLTMTDPTMTRFWQTPREAAELVLRVLGLMEAAPLDTGGRVFVRMLPASSIGRLMQAVLANGERGGDYPVLLSGPRHTEKRDEELLHEGESPYVRRWPGTADLVAVRPLGEADPHAPYLRYWSNGPDTPQLSTEQLAGMVRESYQFLDEVMD